MDHIDYVYVVYMIYGRTYSQVAYIYIPTLWQFTHTKKPQEFPITEDNQLVLRIALIVPSFLHDTSVWIPTALLQISMEENGPALLTIIICMTNVMHGMASSGTSHFKMLMIMIYAHKYVYGLRNELIIILCMYSLINCTQHWWIEFHYDHIPSS